MNYQHGLVSSKSLMGDSSRDPVVLSLDLESTRFWLMFLFEAGFGVVESFCLEGRLEKRIENASYTAG